MRGKILLVEPEEMTAQPLAAMLTRAEFTVLTAESGDEALRLVHRELPDLIILNLALPGMSGIETLRQLRECGVSAKVMIHTANGTPQNARESRALGVREFLGKPFDAHRLLRIVNEEVGEKVMR
jgi:DNA-binding response OmpR family regulator